MELMITKLRRPVAAFLLALFICAAPLLAYRRAQAAAITTAITASFVYDALATLFVMMCGYKVYDAITTDENGKAVPTEQSKKAFSNAAEKAGYSEAEAREEVKRQLTVIEGGGGKEPNMNDLAKVALQSTFFKHIYDSYRLTHSQDDPENIPEATEEFIPHPNYYHSDGIFSQNEIVCFILDYDFGYKIVYPRDAMQYVGYRNDNDYRVYIYARILSSGAVDSYGSHAYGYRFTPVFKVEQYMEMVQYLKNSSISIGSGSGFSNNLCLPLYGFSYSNSFSMFMRGVNFPIFKSKQLFDQWKEGKIGFDPEYLINPNGVVKPGTNYEIQTNPDAEVNHLEDVTTMEDLQKVLEEHPIEDILGQTNTNELIGPDTSPGPSPEPSPSVSPLPDEEFPEQDLQDFEVPAAVVNKFPFCIPFDLIKTVQVLAAPPEAPVFELPFYFPRYGIDEKITIDFKQFESLAKISRYFFDLLFILGLILLTRGLIKG